MAKDPHWGNVVLAMHMDGADNSIVFNDLTGKTVALSGQVKLSSSAPKFGSSSGVFDGTSDYLSVPALLVKSIDFTIECFVKFNSVVAGQIICATYNTAPYQNGAFVLFLSGGKITVYGPSFGGIGSISAVANQWHHVAMVYTHANTTVKLYVDGVLAGSGVGGITAEAPTFFIGGSPGDANIGALWLNGYIDDFRVTRGVARYTANFTPPIEPFLNGPYEVGGTILDANNSPVSRTIRVYDRVTGALAGSGQSSPVTGIYNIAINTANEVQVVMLDDALGTLENDQIIRTIPV